MDMKAYRLVIEGWSGDSAVPDCFQLSIPPCTACSPQGLISDTICNICILCGSVEKKRVKSSLLKDTCQNLCTSLPSFHISQNSIIEPYKVSGPYIVSA